MGVREAVFDIENNGLFRETTKGHCIVAIDMDTGRMYDWKPWEFEEGAKFLSECEVLVGHNIIGHDLPVLEKLCPGIFTRPKVVWDTLCVARTVFPGDTLLGRDMAMWRNGKLPGNLIKGQSLKAWGYRLGQFKGEYTGGWDEWSQPMHDYMCQDGRVSVALWKMLLRHLGWRDGFPGGHVWPERAIENEQDAARIIFEQEHRGFYFRKQQAAELSGQLLNAQAKLQDALQEAFGEWWAPLDDPDTGKFPKRNMKRKRKDLGPDQTEDFSTDAAFCRIKRVSFQAGSRDHLGKRLQELFGWVPTKFGKNKKPTVDEATLKDIPDTVLPTSIKEPLLEHFVIAKILGMLSLGAKSWLGLVEDDSRIHGRMNTGGAITGRGTHFNPNLSTVPAVQEDKDTGEPIMGLAGGYGFECRSLFGAEPPLELTGVDVSRLELALLGHALHPFDGGRYADIMSDPNRDPHQETADDVNLPRRDAKTVTYCIIFGGGGAKAGEELGIEEHEIEGYLRSKRLRGMLTFLKRVQGKEYVEPTDLAKAKMVKGAITVARIIDGIVGFKELRQNAMELGASRKWMTGLDGRKIYVRKPHASVNTLLQGNGAIVCKAWMAKTNCLIGERKPEGTYCGQVVWSHDELQFEHTAGLGPLIIQAAKDAITAVEQEFGLKVRLYCDGKTGKTWAETH